MRTTNGDRDERLGNRDEPPRRPEVEWGLVKGDQEPESEHHGRGAERKQDEAVDRAGRAGARGRSPRALRRRAAIDAATPAKTTEYTVASHGATRRRVSARRAPGRLRPWPSRRHERSTRTASGKRSSERSGRRARRRPRRAPPLWAGEDSLSSASCRSATHASRRRGDREHDAPRLRAAAARASPLHAGRTAERPGCRSPSRRSRPRAAEDQDRRQTT